ncbi:adenine phosphoribosyltransferase [Thermaerobacter marianensis DSM 12885]|uniref:Adenine phosphoribosyltransferase n=1 Tax=Thermaerobacter marianensis (strain ATCC 700841 / DSM 12885 / JCM 10246 / 7p75a) TaxID=644966 RepID=E6SL70_THEM7|nr:adenine phosphoribosyltransferase [Thermaerobacter marianensis]ADU51301.1 adenine phosphoribosyltransferase [Thermaerobacter marianensis DSM 12885]
MASAFHIADPGLRGPVPGGPDERGGAAGAGPGGAAGPGGTAGGAEGLRAWIRQVPDYPVPGVTFLDITPLLGHGPAFRQAIDALAGAVAGIEFDRILAIEARGFLLGAPLAVRLGKGFVPARKPGKLPLAVARQDYQLEYGEAAIEVHRDAVAPGDRVLIVDDVLATGGTSAAAAALVEQLGGRVAGFAYLIEIAALAGRRRLGDRPVRVVLPA